MKEHKEIKKLVYDTLKVHNDKGNYPTASELYNSVSREVQRELNGLRSFAKIINIFPEIEQVGPKRGVSKKYKLKDSFK